MSPTAIATSLGLIHRKVGKGSGELITLDKLVDLAVLAYWKRRNEKRGTA